MCTKIMMDIIKKFYMFVVILDLSGIVCSQDDGMNTSSIQMYLEKYQYLGKMSPDPRMQELVSKNQTQAALKRAILIYQKTWGLPDTGKLNPETVDMMAIQRCGMPDIQMLDDLVYMATDEQEPEEEWMRKSPHTSGARHSPGRYFLSGYSHRKLDLTYSMVSYPSNGPAPSTVDRLVGMAYQIWQSASQLTFRRVHMDEADIVMSFLSKKHRDDHKQKRDFNDLAHAFYPNQYFNGSQIHFNDDKKWVEGLPANSHESDLAYVTLHEIGHALGLGHVHGNNNSIMNPYYQRREVPALDQDDIDGINTLYETERGDVLQKRYYTVMAMEMKPMMSDFCARRSIDAIALRTEAGVPFVYAFQGNAYVRMRDGMVEAGYPRLISEGWPGLPADIEAISSPSQFRSHGQEFVETLQFVKNGTFYNFQNQELKNKQSVSKHPKKSEKWDAIFNFGKTSLEYYLAGGWYTFHGLRGWRKLEHFLPFFNDTAIDAAFSVNRTTTYFFSGTDFYVVYVKDNPNPKLMDGYPKDIAKDFLHCGLTTMKMIMAGGDNSTAVPPDISTTSGCGQLSSLNCCHHCFSVFLAINLVRLIHEA